MKPLLVLIDLQRDYLESVGLEPSAGMVVEQAARLLAQCRELAVPAVHVRMTVTRAPDNRLPHWKSIDRWLCEAGTPGWESPPALAPRSDETLVSKAGFSGFHSATLQKVVRELSIDTLVVCGVHLHACVRQTVLDAHHAGLAVWVAEDAAASDDPLHAATTRRYLEARGVWFAPVQALTARLAGTRPIPAATQPSAVVRTALDKAWEFGKTWRPQAFAVRALLVQRLADQLAARVEPLAEEMARTIHKPVRFGRVEVQRTAEMLGAIVRRFQDGGTEDAAGPARVRRRPHGVLAVVTPWNNPIYLALGKIVPAVLAGNTVVWKPAPEARAVNEQVAACLAAAGWPGELVNRVEGGRREAEDLLSDPALAAATITGSSAAGFSAQEICARRRIPLQAELGGNNAAIVWSDADLADAARQVAAGAFDMAGQRCTANRRAIIPAECRERFLALLQEAAAGLPWGDPLEPETRIGPLVGNRQHDRVAGMVKRAAADGALVLWPQGRRPPFADRRPWHPPTIVVCGDPEREIVQEETFGPVLVVQPAHNWDHALQLCNGVRQGLAAAIFTRSDDLVDRFLEGAEAGILKVNQSTADALVDVPFGGWKASGLGPPEHGAFDVDFYTRPQTVYGPLSQPN